MPSSFGIPKNFAKTTAVVVLTTTLTACGPVRAPMAQARQRATMADIRAIGTAIEMWAVDQRRTAAPIEQLRESNWRDCSAINASALKELLVPKYLEALPTNDHWGHPLEFCLNVSQPAAPLASAIRSSGRDGAFDGASYAFSAFPAGDYDRDLVWADGRFTAWPADTTP